MSGTGTDCLLLWDFSDRFASLGAIGFYFLTGSSTLLKVESSGAAADFSNLADLYEAHFF